jgi:hypothetical protein
MELQRHGWRWKSRSEKIIYENNTIDSRNLEHQNGAFYWNLDNWIYPSRDNLRYKFKNGTLLVDTLVDNMIGQWGLTSDNYGKLFYSEAGPGLPAVQIQQMPAYGALNFKDQYAEDFTILWPVIGNVDAQGGRALCAKTVHWFGLLPAQVNPFLEAIVCPLI